MEGIPSDVLVGCDFVDTCIEGMSAVRTRPMRDAMTKKERKKLHQDIACTIRPGSHRGPPVNLGEESHGKLKADELRSLAEFDLVVTASEMKSGPLNGRYESLNLTCTCLNDQSHGHDKVTYGRMCYFQLMLNFGCVSSIVFLIIILLFLYYKQPGSIQSCKCVNLMHPVWGLDRAI